MFASGCCNSQLESAETVNVEPTEQKVFSAPAPAAEEPKASNAPEAAEEKCEGSVAEEPKTVDEKSSGIAGAPAEGVVASTEVAKAEDNEQETVARKPVPLCKMFSLASPGDLLILSMGIVGAVGNGSGMPLMIFVFGKLIDSMGASDMSDQITTMLILSAVMFFLASFQALGIRWFAQRQVAKMCRLYYESMLYKDISWFDLQRVAALPTDLLDDTNKMAEALGDKFGNSISAIASVLVALPLGFTVGPEVAAISLAALPMMAVGAIVFGKSMEAVANETQNSYSQAAAVVEESLLAVRTVVAFGGERGAIQDYEKAVLKARAGGVRQSYATGFGVGWTDGWWGLGSAVCLFYGMTQIYNGRINSLSGRVYTGGDILSVFFNVLVAGFMLGNVEPGVKAMKIGRTAAARFWDVVEAPSVIQCQKEDSRRPVTSFESFELQEVHFSYPARPSVSVLNGLSLSILKGQKVAIVGESGCGKSTVMSLLERFYDPAQGSVLLNGENLKEFAPSSLRAMIGYVGQEPVLFATSVEQNIMWGWPSASKDDFQEAADAARLDFLNDMPQGIMSFVGAGGSQFSGGQKQRIAIARALLRKPKVLFLDEATSALDSASECMIQETIESIVQSDTGEHPVTAVSIAHRLTTVMDADVIFVLRRGVVAEQGTHEELMQAKGIYYSLAATQGLTESDGRLSRMSRTSRTSRHSGESSRPGRATVTQLTGPSSGQVEADADTQEEVKKMAKDYKVPYRQLYSYNKPEWPLFLPAVLCSLLHGANYPVQAYLLVGILDLFFKPKEEMWDGVTELVIILAVFSVVVSLATMIHSVAFGILSEGLTQRLRVALLTNVLRQEVGFHDNPNHTPALLGTALQSWAFRIRVFLASMEAKAQTVASVVLGLLVAFEGSWEMTLTSFVTGPILVAALGVQMMFMLNAMNTGNENIQQAQQLVSDTVQNARTVQATCMERSCIERFSSCVAEGSGGLKNHAISGLAFGVAAAAPMFYLAFAFWFADWLVQNGRADFKGSLRAFFGTMYAAQGAGQAGVLVGDLSKAKAACHDMFKILNRKSMIDGLEPSGEKPAWASQPESRAESGRIEFQNVKFSYPFRKDVEVLKGVSFKIEPSQSVGLVGPSGGGKTTIMALIQRFYDPVEGSVLIGAARVPLSSINIRWWRKQVGFVGQEPILFNTTVRGNVLYGLDTEAGETISEERLAACKRMAHLDFLDSASNKGWETEVGPRGGRLSGGQKQRVAICRALVRDPAVLLLDEATSALDTESERVVQQALENARQGRTSIAIAHRLSTVEGCDVILVAAQGVIIESGSHAELMAKKGVYFKLKNGITEVESVKMGALGTGEESVPMSALGSGGERSDSDQDK